MIACPYCSNLNREGVLFCEECGTPLTGSSVGTTQVMPTDTLRPTPAAVQEAAKPITGTAVLTSSTNIIIKLNDKNVAVDLLPQSEILVGRRDEQEKIFPEIDLTPHDGVEKGVSRKHAIIRRTEDTLTVTDLGSANGTFLNGQKLIANQPHVLRDGDEISFGKLVSRIYYK